MSLSFVPLNSQTCEPCGKPCTQYMKYWFSPDSLRRDINQICKGLPPRWCWKSVFKSIAFWKSPESCESCRERDPIKGIWYNDGNLMIFKVHDRQNDTIYRTWHVQAHFHMTLTVKWVVCPDWMPCRITQWCKWCPWRQFAQKHCMLCQSNI